MKDMRDATYILGIRLYKDKSQEIDRSLQSLYIENMLKRFNMLNSKRRQLPIWIGIHLSKEMSPNTPKEKDRMSKVPYASAARSLMYAMICTGQDIAYVVSVVSRYQSDPNQIFSTCEGLKICY